MELKISQKSHFLSQLENQIALDLPKVEINVSKINWRQYNPRKEIKRFGGSITSLDGLDTGIPDLDSLREYNLIYQTQYGETDFRTWTRQGEPFRFLSDFFDIGRSHFLRLEAGGYFPYHRDLSSECIRLVYTINNCQPTNLVWLQNGQVLGFENHAWYYVNTIQAHALFAFSQVDLAVFNIIKTDKSITHLTRKFKPN